MKFLRKFLMIIGGLLLFTFLAFFVVYLMNNEPVPESKKSSDADILAREMLTSINYDVYLQTRFLEWSFASGSHNYKWDKKNGRVVVKWKDYTVNLNLNNTSKSHIIEGDKKMSVKESNEIINTALNYFNNDSFWLVAPFKIFDKGVTRGVVVLNDGSNALLVNYATGGTTPGDTYLWKINEKGFPESYQMWVKILPIGGISATWDDWTLMENGLFLSTSHKIGPMTFDMGKVRAYN